MHQGFCDGRGRDRLAVVMTDRADPFDEVGRECEPDDVVNLPVAVLFHHVDPLVSRDERDHLVGERQGAQAEVVDGLAGRNQRLPRLDDRGMRRAERDQTGR